MRDLTSRPTSVAEDAPVAEDSVTVNDRDRTNGMHTVTCGTFISVRFGCHVRCAERALLQENDKMQPASEENAAQAANDAFAARDYVLAAAKAADAADSYRASALSSAAWGMQWGQQ